MYLIREKLTEHRKKRLCWISTGYRAELIPIKTIISHYLNRIEDKHYVGLATRDLTTVLNNHIENWPLIKQDHTNSVVILIMSCSLHYNFTPRVRITYVAWHWHVSITIIHQVCVGVCLCVCVCVSCIMSEQVRISNGICSWEISNMEDVPDRLDKRRKAIPCFVHPRPYWTELKSLK